MLVQSHSMLGVTIVFEEEEVWQANKPGQPAWQQQTGTVLFPQVLFEQTNTNLSRN